jgi:hypothetical protein
MQVVGGQGKVAVVAIMPNGVDLQQQRRAFSASGLHSYAVEISVVPLSLPLIKII